MNFLSVLYAKAGITVDGVTTLNNTATGLTPATNDNSTKLATTGYVKNQNYYPYPTGTTAQYVRGDGSLATFTQTGGGGSSVSYYLNGSVSQGTIGGNAYYEMSKNAIIGTNADFSINADGYVAQFVTDAGDPALLSIPGGNWNFEMWFSASSGGGTPSFYVELYKYDGTTLTLIASGSAAPESITGGTSTDLYITALAVPTTTLTLTDRLAVRVYVNHSGRTITLHTQNGHLCQVITSFTTGLTALNGLTAQVQNFAVGTGGTDFNISSVTDTHTFNLPTASATKRGALSSIDWSAFDAKVDFGDLSATSPLSYNGSGVFSIAQSSTSTNGYLSSTDWNTFNNKQNAITLTTTGTSGAATLVGSTLNIPQYQSVLTNPITGTGTTNYLPKFTGTSALGNSALQEGTSYIQSSKRIEADDAGYSLVAFSSAGNRQVVIGVYSGEPAIQGTLLNGTARQLSINSNGGNVLIGTSGDNGQKFQLLGDAAIYKNAEFLQSIAVNSGESQYQTWRNSVGTRRGYFGFPTGSSNDLVLHNETGGIIGLYGGNVLIGTTTDNGAKLQVNGSPYFGSDAFTFNNGGIFFSGYGSYARGVYSNSNGLTLQTSGSPKVTINDSGYVGVGTQTPNYRLESTSTALFGTTAYGVLNIAGDNPSYIKIKTNIPFSYGSQGYTVNIKGFQYGSAQTLDLQVCWHQYADAFYSPTITSKGSFAPVVRLARESGLVVIVLTWGQYWPKLYVESVHNYANDGYANGWTWVDENVTGDKTVTLSYKNDFGDGFVKTAAGLVGIGTNSPSYKLHVVASTGAGDYVAYIQNTGAGNGLKIYNADWDATDYLLYTSNGGGYVTVIDGNGRVGIGTTSPSNRLEVKGVDNSTIQAIFQATSAGNAAYNGGIQLGNAASNQNSQIYHDSSGDNTLTFKSNYSSGTGNKFIFAPGGTETVRFQQNGNVGIGTTSPGKKLDVVGTTETSIRVRDTGGAALEFYQQALNSYILATNNFFFYTAGSERMRIDTTGNVSIGAVVPTATLDVRSKAASGSITAPTFRAFGYDTDSYFQVNSNASNSADIKLTRSDATTMFQINGHTGLAYFNGNIGVGVTPSAWTSFSVLQNTGGSLIGAAGELQLWQNAYYDGASKYYATGTATRYGMTAGQHRWYYAVSGTANAALTWVQSMTLNESGNLGLGIVPTTSSARTIQFGAGAGLGTNSTNNTYFYHNATIDASANLLYAVTGQQASMYRQINGAHQWLYAAAGTAGNAITFTQQMTLDASGQLLIGTTTSSSYKLDVNGTARVSGALTANNGIFNGVSSTNLKVQNGANANTLFLIQSFGTEALGENASILFKSAANSTDTTYAKGLISFVNNGTGYGRGSLIFATNNSTNSTNVTASDVKLTIAATGEATFSSSVTATNFIGAGTGLTGTASALSIGGNAAYATTAGALTSMNISQFTNDAGYITSTSSTFSYTASVTLSPTWQNTGVSSANLTGSGVYIVTCNANDFGVSGGQYNCTYTGIMYWFAGGTNGSNVNEIVLHHTGHADNGRYIYLRTINTVSADGKTYLQISGNGTNSGASNYQLTFKKIL